MQRRPTHELLDSDAGSPEEIAASLRDLRWFNRWFGGITTSSEMIKSVAKRSHTTQLSLLEVASGEGFVQKEVADQLRQEGITLDFTLLDRASTHLPKNGAVQKIAADALQLPFYNATFDLVSCSLFVHHLSPEQVVVFVREALRVCRAALLVHDLIRHPLHLAWAYAGIPLYRSRITRNDAPASVKQAYTVDEMRELCQKAGAVEIEIERHFLFRMGAIVWKP
jgi:ubiquinone/menaquinone biosynthesis C-methylase UbiE